MSVLFNLGIISLLTPLIQKGVENDKTYIAEIRELDSSVPCCVVLVGVLSGHRQRLRHL